MYHSGSASHVSPLWKRMLHLVFRFVFSRKGIITIVALLIFLPLIWMYLILGAFRTLYWDMAKLGGVFQEKIYLLLLQNENELRPTGGFLTSFAVIKVKRGIPDIAFYNTEQVAIPQPEIQAPSAIETAFSKDPKYAGWVFRDSNFSLDFEENAKKAVEFLQIDPLFKEEQFHGVIAVDINFLEDIVNLLGPFEFEGENLAGRDLFENIEFVAKNFDHHDFNQWQSRKESILPLAKEIIQSLKSSPKKWESFFSISKENANQKHLLFFFPDTGLQKKMQEKGWTGNIPSSFWSVNFANLGGRKGDRFLRKRFESSVHIEADGDTEERFSIYLSHEGTYHLQSDLYQAFVRIVRPQGYELKNVEGDFDILPDHNEQKYGEEYSFFLKILPGEKKVFTFFFTPSEENQFSSSETVSIMLVKQPGTLSPHWDFTLRGENDPRFSAEGCTTASSRENIFFCDVTLNTDTRLLFKKHPDTTPPLLQFAEFVSADRIEARFSEDIFSDIPFENFVLIRADGSEEKIPITEVHIEGESVLLDLADNPPRSEGERFFLEIKNIRDISENMFQGKEPGTFFTTLVQQ